MLGCIWGSSFIMIKKILPCYTPIQYALGRVIATGLCFSIWLPQSIQKINKNQLKWLVIVAATGYFMSYLFMGISQTRISSSLAGILSSLNPLATFVIGIALFGQSFKWSNMAGITIGLVGCTLLVFSRSGGSIQFQFYSLFLILSIVVSGFSINVVQKKLKGLSALVIASISFGCLVLPCALLFFTMTDWRHPFNHPAIVSCSLAFLFLTLVSTVFGSLVYFHLISRTGALYTSTVTYIIPMMAIFLGVLDGEVVGWTALIGFSFIIGGIKLVRA